MKGLWAAEPILVALASSSALWGAIPPVLAAFGHPLTDAQNHSLGALLYIVGGIISRFSVTAPDTLAAIKAANQNPT